MSWSVILICVVTVLYTGVAIDSLRRGNWPIAVIYAGYAFANIGLIAVAK